MAQLVAGDAEAALQETLAEARLLARWTATPRLGDYRYVLVTARDALTLVPELKAALEKQGRGDIMIVIGGVVPPQDYDALYAAGAKAIFPPGTVIAEAAADLLLKLMADLGYEVKAAE